MYRGATDSNIKIATSGLSLYLDAAQLRSYPRTGTTWTDLSGNGNNGTLTGPTAVPTFSTSNGGAIDFDGTEDYINCGNGSSLNITGTTLTLSAWVRADTITSYRTIIHKELQYSLTFYDDAGTKKISYADSSNWSYTNFGYHGNFPVSTWYNIVAVKNGTTVTIYSNNSQVVSQTFGGSITSTTNSVSVGNYLYSGGTLYFFDGLIANAMIYNTALSATDVARNYNAYKSRFGL